MRTLAQGMWDWFSARAHTTHAYAWLFLLSFSESSFFIVPPEILMMPMLAADGRRWVRVALFTTGASLLGAIFGYFIAFFFFDTIGERIIELYHLEDEFAHVAQLFEENVFWVMLTAAFTPIPFKVFVLAAGFFKVNFFWFFVASTIGRTLRYLIIAYLAKRFGPHLTELVLKYANIVTVVVVAIIAVVTLLLLI